MPITPDPDAEISPAGEPAAGPEAPQPRRTLAAIEAENEIRRAVEDRERALAEMPADEPLASPAPAPLVVEKLSAAPFYDELAPHGEWLHADDYGDVWQPSYANTPDWRPYTDGSWAYTEAGWTWDSDEPCGDITCHYGRWVNLTDSGWCWVPGYDWAPAWVSWRCSDEFIGWAPLPPCVPWRPAAGLGPWVDACGDLGPGSYCFVPVRHFSAANCRPVLCARSQSTDHFRHTRNLTRLVCKPGADGRSHPVLDGPDVDRIAAVSPKDLRHRRLRWVDASVSRSARGLDREVVSMRRLSFPATAGAPEHGPKASRRLERATPANPWIEAGDPKSVAAARRQVFAEARQTFRGLPRLVPPVGTPEPAAPRPRQDEVRVAQAAVIESPRARPGQERPALVSSTAPRESAAAEQPGRPIRTSVGAGPAGNDTATSPVSPRGAREAVRDSSSNEPPRTRVTTLGKAPPPAVSSPEPRRLESSSSVPGRSADRPSTRGAERLAAQAARDQQAREALRQQQEAETQAAAEHREQVQQQQQARQQQELAAQRVQDDRDRRVAEQRTEQAREQAMVEQQQYQPDLERRGVAERQRQQAEARQQQEMERRQQLEQARQQAMAQARQHEEAQQREQMEHSRRQAEMQARQLAAEQRQRENEARQQQEIQRRQAEEHQRQQQSQEAQERAQAARQQQFEEARQRQQAEAGRQREQEAARQQGGHSQEKRGR